jgi:hypothetical protein
VSVLGVLGRDASSLKVLDGLLPSGLCAAWISGVRPAIWITTRCTSSICSLRLPLR